MVNVSRFLTALAVMAILLLGAAGSASAHALMTDHGAVHHDEPCTDHDDDQRAPPCDSPQQDRHHGMPMAAPCCPSIEAPARIAVFRITMMSRVAWHPPVDSLLATLLIAPEPPPPRAAA